jgi:hypothetical protein
MNRSCHLIPPLDHGGGLYHKTQIVNLTVLSRSDVIEKEGPMGN